eukprot:scpid86292/ scgid16268/ 
MVTQQSGEWCFPATYHGPHKQHHYNHAPMRICQGCPVTVSFHQKTASLHAANMPRMSCTLPGLKIFKNEIATTKAAWSQDTTECSMSCRKSSKTESRRKFAQQKRIAIQTTKCMANVYSNSATASPQRQTQRRKLIKKKRSRNINQGLRNVKSNAGRKQGSEC